VTVLICAYTERRWDQMVAAVGSAAAQTLTPAQIVLVIDHNPDLLERSVAEFPGADVVANRYESGLSGARNTGVDEARGDVISFLDDDACAEPDWLATLVAPYADPTVVGTGGVARAAWPDVRPPWFPSEFDWVVGCSYRGLPVHEAPIRNPIGANMSFRRSAFTTAGGFQTDFGRVGTLPLGCEETEFSIRLRALVPDAKIIHVPGALVDHTVSADRVRVDYFLRRCIAEGLSKAAVTAHVGREQGLASERAYVTRALPSGFLHGLLPGGTDGAWRPTRSVMIVAGLAATTLGYVLGRLKLGSLASRLAAAPKPKAPAH
jgi:GT2 family glycosyltransferase